MVKDGRLVVHTPRAKLQPAVYALPGERKETT